MTVIANINIIFYAENAAHVQEVVDALALPEGANINASVTEQLFAGTVNAEGQIVDSPMMSDIPDPDPDA